MPRQILIKQKINKKLLKLTKEKQPKAYQGIPIRISADFSAYTLTGQKGVARCM